MALVECLFMCQSELASIAEIYNLGKFSEILMAQSILLGPQSFPSLHLYS